MANAITVKEIMENCERNNIGRMTNLALWKLRGDLEQKINDNLGEGDCYVHLQQYEMFFKNGKFEDKIGLIVEFYDDDDDVYLEFHITKKNVSPGSPYVAYLAEALIDTVNSGECTYTEEDYVKQFENNARNRLIHAEVKAVLEQEKN